MIRQNLFSDAWTETTKKRDPASTDGADDARMEQRCTNSPPTRLDGGQHMHFGVEEMFFVLSGRPSSGTNTAKRRCSAISSSAPRTRRSTRFTNPTEKPAQILAISAGSYPTSSETEGLDPAAGTQGAAPELAGERLGVRALAAGDAERARLCPEGAACGAPVELAAGSTPAVHPPARDGALHCHG